MYCMGVNSMASGLTFLHQSNTPCQYILLYATVMKCIAYTIFTLFGSSSEGVVGLLANRPALVDPVSAKNTTTIDLSNVNIRDNFFFFGNLDFFTTAFLKRVDQLPHQNFPIYKKPVWPNSCGPLYLLPLI